MKSKTNFKKLLSIALACVMMVVVSVSAVGSVAFADENVNMNENDILKAYAASRPQDQTGTRNSSTTEVTMTIESFVKLYSPDGDVVAYYIEEDNGQYAVVNSLVDNPIYLEYGKSDESLNEIKTADKVYYFSPGNFAKYSSEEEKFYSLNGNIEYSNEEATALFARLNFAREEKNEAMEGNVERMNVAVQRGESSSVIVSYIDLPNGNYSGASVSGFSNIQFSNSEAILGEIVNGNPADNNCGSTAAFNVLQYYRAKFNNKITGAYMKGTQMKVHEYIGNGPVTPTHLNLKFTSYINNETDYNLNMATTTTNFNNLKTRISNDQLLYFVTVPLVDLGKAHIFIGYGYIEDAISGNHYVRVMDGWSASTDRYYLFSTSLYQMGYIYLTE